MIWPFRKKVCAKASPEALAALLVAKGEVEQSKRLHKSASRIREVADAAVERNHFGLSVTAAMRGEP